MGGTAIAAAAADRLNQRASREFTAGVDCTAVVQGRAGTISPHTPAATNIDTCLPCTAVCLFAAAVERCRDIKAKNMAAIAAAPADRLDHGT